MDENYSNETTLSLSDTSPTDIGSDGSLSFQSDNSGISSDQLPDYSPLSTNDIAPLDNINGTSNTDGNASPALYSTFSGGSGISSLLNDLTGGAQDLADGLSGIIDPTEANSTATNGISTGTILLIGGGALLLFLLVAK